MAASRREKTARWYPIAAIAIPLLQLLGRYELVHPERVPATGAFVMSPNHVSNLDPVISGYALWRAGRVPRFLAKASLFRVPVLGALLRWLGQIPVERAGMRADPGAPVAAAAPMAAAKRLVEQGLAVIVYPEGTLTRDPDLWPMRGKTGAVRLALEEGIPLVPAAHWGVQEIMPRYGKLRIGRRPIVRYVFGEPLDLGRFAGRPLDRAVLEEATDELMAAITALVAELRDEEPPAQRWDPAVHGQSETGRIEP